MDIAVCVRAVAYKKDLTGPDCSGKLVIFDSTLVVVADGLFLLVSLLCLQKGHKPFDVGAIFIFPTFQ